MSEVPALRRDGLRREPGLAQAPLPHAAGEARIVLGVGMQSLEKRHRRDEPPARAQHAPALGERARGVGDMLEDLGGLHRVEDRLVERQGLDVHGDVGTAREIEVGDDPARSRRRPEDAATPAAAHVEHSALEGGIKGLEIGVHALAPVGDPEIVGEPARHASLRAAAA